MCRSRLWLLALPLAALTCASAWGGHWSNEEISDKFKEIEKKLRAFEDCYRRDRAANRRILDLESKVRDLRTAVKELQDDVKSANVTLVALRKDLAKLAGQALAAKPRTGTTPGTTRPGTEPEGPLTEILTERRRTEGDLITITGTVRNVSERPLTFVVVEATFLGAQGNTLKTESGYTSPRVIAAGAIASFKIVTRHDLRIRRHQLSVRAK
jgi:hypothetical protein